MKIKVILLSFALTMLIGAFYLFSGGTKPQDVGFKPIPPRPNIGVQTVPWIPPDITGMHVIKNSFVNIATRDYAGAGMVIEPGLVLTNAHVVLDSNGKPRQRRFSVTLYDGSSTTGVYVAHSNTYDLAVLRVPDDFGLPALVAADEVPLQQDIIAVGNPYNGAWLAHGTVLALDLWVRHAYTPDRSPKAVRMFVMNAALRPGYSGGPIIHPVSGEVYGVSVGLAERYKDPQTGAWVVPRKMVGLAIHISDALTEVEKILPSS